MGFLSEILDEIDSRSGLSEATFEGDAASRKRAVSFVSSLQLFIEKHPDFLTKNSKGYYVPADLFWRDPRAHGLTVLFIPKGKGEFGIGESGVKRVLQIPILRTDLNIDHLSDFVSTYSKQIIHEIIHWIDKGMGKGKGVDISTAKSYYNHPSEWNAFFQEGAYAVDKMLDGWSDMDPGQRKRVFGIFFGNGSFKDFQKNADKFWSKDFLNSLDRKNRVKFDKRLYQYWNGIKDELK